MDYVSQTKVVRSKVSNHVNSTLKGAHIKTNVYNTSLYFETQINGRRCAIGGDPKQLKTSCGRMCIHHSTRTLRVTAEPCIT